MAVEVCSATSASSSGFRPGARSFCRSENVQLSDDVAASLSLSLTSSLLLLLLPTRSEASSRQDGARKEGVDEHPLS